MKTTTLRADTQEKYVLYLNGLFFMLEEEGFLPFDGWAVLNRVSPTKINKSKLNTIAQLIGEAILDAENSSTVIKVALKNYKSAFSKLKDYIQSI